MVYQYTFGCSQVAKRHISIDSLSIVLSINSLMPEMKRLTACDSSCTPNLSGESISHIDRL